MTRLPHEPPEPWMPDEPPPCRHCAWTFTTGDPDEECHVRLRAEVDRLLGQQLTDARAERDRAARYRAFRDAAVPGLQFVVHESLASDSLIEESRAALDLARRERVVGCGSGHATP